jgi:hypothetical protein
VAKHVDRLIEDVKEARAEFEARSDDLEIAKERYYGAVRRLYERGMPLRDIADAVGVSHQRVHQIVGDQRPAGRVKRAAAKQARAGGAALLIVLAASWIATSRPPQPTQEALAAIEEARSFMARELPSDAREFVLPRLDQIIERTGR